MTAIDHAGVQAWLDEAFFAPSVLGDDDTPGDVHDHLATCAGCAEYADSLRATALKLDLARGPLPRLRGQVLEAVRTLGRTRRPAAAATGRPWFRAAFSWQLGAAVLVIALIGASLGAWWGLAARPGAVEASELARAVEMMADLAAEPGAHEMILHDAAGQSAGVVLISTQTHQVALFSSALARPPVGSYECFLESHGQRTRIGPMHYAEGISFWAGWMSDSMNPQPGDALVVAADESAPQLLSASF